MITYQIDSVQFFPKSQICEVRGWAAGSEKQDIELKVIDKSGKDIDQTFRRTIRRDISFETNLFPGFVLSFSYGKNRKYSLVFSTHMECVKTPIEPAKKSFHPMKLLRAVNPDTLKRAITYCRLNGLKATLQKLSQGYTEPSAYHEWFLSQRISEKELQEQKKAVFPYSPRISIIVPTYNTPELYLKAMLDSVLEQTYSNWELCIADASSSETTRNVLHHYMKKDSRIRINWLNENY